jgi:hypothetical protein
MLCIVLHTVARIGRSYEHFPDGFELDLLPLSSRPRAEAASRKGVAGRDSLPPAQQLTPASVCVRERERVCVCV